jgi:hypothetical protein
MRESRSLGVLLLLLITALWIAAPIAPTFAAAATVGKQSKSAQAKPGQKVTRGKPKAERDREEREREARGRRTPGAARAETINPTILEQGNSQGNGPKHEPREHRMQRAGSFDGDLRSLPSGPPKRRERPEREGPEPAPVQLRDPDRPAQNDPAPSGLDPQPLGPAPGPIASFEGLDFANWGAGHPPDTNGDVGPSYYIQSVNTSIGIYDKATGSPVARFTFDTFMSQGNFGNVCDDNNFGDPVVLYDTFEDRWVITDFAFVLDASQNVVNPPGAFECFAVSKTGDPVSGGWNYYSINTTGGLGDYPKLAIWPDGLYMSVNMFDYAAAGSFQHVRLYALNKAQMYAGDPVVQIVFFDLPATEFTVLPSNARLQTGTPPVGAPNYFASVWNFLNAVSVWKFHVDWSNLGASTLTGPVNSITAGNWSQLVVSPQPAGTVPSPANRLDTLYPRLMMQNQYSNISGIEALWNSHTVGASGTSSSRASVRYYEVRVTGGAVAANATQAFTYSPADTTNRFMPSVAVDRAGNMAIGYSGSSSTLNPVIRYAGRLAADPVNSITQTETNLIAGTGSQSGSCGGTCMRWGDYSAMSLDPDGCSFWNTNEYYQVTGLNDRTRIGAFNFASCSPVIAGTLQGTVKTPAAVPIAGATVTLGSRTTTTDSGGNYSFNNIGAGTYPSVTASSAGYSSSTFTSIVISSGGTTTRDFVLSQAAQSGCLTDTTQPDFQAGASTNCDVTGTLGSVTLVKPIIVNQQNLSVTNSGFTFTTTGWAGQTFTPTVSGLLTRIDLDLFCSGCSGTPPNITVSIRATTGSPPVPTGADLAVASIAGFSSGAGGYMSAPFASPATLTAGTRYAVIIRTASVFLPGAYAYVCSCGTGPANTNPYANGQRVTSTNSGATWAADTTSGGRDLGFVAYMQSSFAASGTIVSSTKNANPVPGNWVTWGAISWNATVPANTSVQFQAAASNSPDGPFTFVGPDGTAATFFTNGASLSQFSGNRYLKYRAVLSTSNGSVTPTIQDVTVCFNNLSTTAAVVSAAARLQQLQNADGGWYFRASDTNCGAGAGVSCPNIIGVTGLGLLSGYDRGQDPAVLADAVAAGQFLTAIHNANPADRPYSQDLEFLVGLSAASGDPQYATLATNWFGTITAQYANPADRADAILTGRNAQGLRSLAVWDIASSIRAAKAAGNVSYASGMATRAIAREADWKDLIVAHRWDQCGVTGGCGPAGNKFAFDYTLLGMGSMLWAMHDLPGFDAKISEYRSWLLSQQDPSGSWDAGDLQITSYVALGLGAVGGTGTNTAIQQAVSFFIANQLPSHGWPAYVDSSGIGPEYSNVNSEVTRAIAMLDGTQPGEFVHVTPAQLSSVMFSEVLSAGATTVVALSASAPVPFGYRLAPGLTYEVATSASIAGASTVCFSTALLHGLTDVRILHKEGGRFVDRTAADNCATVDTLETFAIAEIDPNAIDSEAPSLSVTLSPATLSPANNKLITIDATITASDNADPDPAITLVSITIGGDANGKNEDIVDAAFGTDDRSFQLRAEKSGKSGRVYTIVYRATDRSGNATDVSAQVFVP